MKIRDTGTRPLTIIWAYDPQMFDPQLTSNPTAYEVFRHVCEPLFYTDTDGVLRGLIAEDEHEYSNDGLEIRIAIRDGILFHDGTRATPEIVVSSFQRLQQLATSPLTDQLRSAVFSVENKKVLVQLPEPDYEFVNRVFTHAYSAIILDTPEDSIFPVCTGAYRFRPNLYSPDERVIIERFQDYSWPSTYHANTLAQIPQIEFKFVEDRDQRFEMLLSAEACVLSLSKEDVPIAARDPDIKLYDTEGGMTYIGFNFARPRWQNATVRRALVQAINKEELVNSGPFNLTDSIFTPSMTGYSKATDDLLSSFDPDTAAQVLLSAGFSFGDEIIIMTPQSRTYAGLFDLIQNQLNSIGISNVSLRQVPQTEMLENRQEYDLLLYDYSWADYTGLGSFLSPGTTRNLLNYPLDDISLTVRTSILTRERDERAALIKHAQTQVLEQTVYAPLLWRKLTKGVNTKCVTGEIVDNYKRLLYHDAQTHPFR